MRMSEICWVRSLRESEDFSSDFLLGALYPLRDVFNDVPVVIASAECHRRVVAARILSQKLLCCALRFDKILPVQSRNRAQTRNAVRNRDLRESNPPV